MDHGRVSAGAARRGSVRAPCILVRLRRRGHLAPCLNEAIGTDRRGVNPGFEHKYGGIRMMAGRLNEEPDLASRAMSPRGLGVVVAGP